ncbi:Mitochondrial intermembrane space import and assembly protein 40 [Erysiphe necator]|nr:Mitochondrial intermembrane space import and assembly protein 40 [Erysiphe necator]
MMFRSAVQVSLRRTLQSRHFQISTSRNLIHSKIASKKSRAWKSVALRWALLVGGIYYYNTHDFLTEELEAMTDTDKLHESNQNLSQITIDAIVEQRQRQQALTLVERQSLAKLLQPDQPQLQDNVTEAIDQKDEKENSADQEEGNREGAFDPETGTINWDCPCLGGMAHGPCGEEFKAAFSCFVYSKEEPKGVECIDKFKNMQNCFRQYPDIYGAELDEESSDHDKAEEGIIENTEKKTQNSEQTSQLPSKVSSSSTDSNPESSPQSDKDVQKSNIEQEKNKVLDAESRSAES